MSFSLDLKKFADKFEKKSDIVVRKIILDISRKIVFRTPVGDADFWASKPPIGYVGGRARANWQHGESLGSSVLDKVDKSGSKTLSLISGSVGHQPAGKKHYLFNNVPYIIPLEEGKLSPRQAPNGMVGLTVLEYQKIVKDAVK